MSRLLISLIIVALATACAGLGPEAAQPTASPTAVPATGTPTSIPLPAPTETQAPPPEPAPSPQGFIAYIAEDGNLMLAARATGDRLQITQDANPLGPDTNQDAPVVGYQNPRWSSDGRYLAYVQEMGTPIESGFEYQYGLWLYDLAAGTSRPLVQNQQVIGFDWQPGTHLLAYGQPIALEYFISRVDGPASEYAGGIWAVDADGGEPYALVTPERGYSLVQPNWSPDGRLLAFEEVQYMEGRGLFAYYDFETQHYNAWDQVIGAYSWSPDGSQVAYDRMAYTPVGTERIWISDRQGGNERALSPEYPTGYAFHPVFSPQGDQLAYLAELEGLDSGQYHVLVVPAAGGEARDLGTFPRVHELSWSPDGQRLYFTSGESEQRRVMEIEVASGNAVELVTGAQPAWQPKAQEAAPPPAAAGAGTAQFETRLSSDRPGVDLIVSYDPGWAEQEYEAFINASAPLDSPYAVEQGLTEGLVQLVGPTGELQHAMGFKLPPEQIEGRIRVQYDTEMPEWVDLVYTPQDLVLVHTFTGSAGMFTLSQVYHLPKQASVDDYRAGLQGSESLLYLLEQGMTFYQVMATP